ncbi:hypothetical protein ACI77I_26355 [Pseudomonas sp. D47]|uniref:hypothetical protein n=1 Tax=Pseudomonas sp. D47 TaxID=3159447 RepID=UPI00387B6C88
MSGASQGNGVPYWFYPVTWILVVVGWIIVNWQNNRREDRKEVRAALTKMYSDISELEKDGITFHTSKQQDYNLASQILLAQGKLSERLSHLRIRRSSYSGELTAFTDSISLENFYDSNFVRQSISSPLANNIRDTAKELEAVLEDEFSNLFRAGLFIKIKSWYLQTKEQNNIFKSLLYCIEKQQNLIIILFAYFGIIGMIYYVLTLIPKK